MAPLELEGDTLGKKHQFYNKLLDKAITTNQVLEPPHDNDDVQTLLNIDIASKRRNVDYLLEVLKSEDQLYVSKAIKRTTWLITDPQYAHIINPEHLYTELYPVMTSKAFNKLMLNIRLHLKDEKRVESFYNYIKEKDVKSALKWLQHCSVPFIEIEIGKYDEQIDDNLILRLFKKSFSIFEIYIKKWEWIVNKCEFLFNEHAVNFLDFIEKSDHLFFNFSAKGTKTLMEKFPQRIIDNIELYVKHLNFATFAKHLNKIVNVKDFLTKHANNDKLKSLFKYNNLQHFIRLIPKENRFEFVKKAFIEKEIDMQDDSIAPYRLAMGCRGDNYASQNTETYQWYKFAPFETAFTDLKKFIRSESAPDQRNVILQVLVSCAGRNMEHIETVLQYYRDKHINEPFKFKIQFVNYFISKVDTHYLDDKTWNILSQLFHSMEVYIESENSVQFCIRAIIVRNAIRNELVSDTIQKKFEFNTLKHVQNKLKTKDEKENVFNYLLKFTVAKIDAFDLGIESEFDKAVTWCIQLLSLIKDWGKNLQDHQYALDTIKSLIKIKGEKYCSKDLSSLYNTNKSWRKIMFEESIAIFPTEEVCTNALKHDPGLLFRNKAHVEAICFNNSVSLRNLIRKIRIYWPVTLANDWKTMYLQKVDQPSGHKSTIVGLITLLPPKELTDFLHKYAPLESKINWNETNQHELSIRKQIAKNVYKARPLAPVEGVLLFAKGDYLQYVVPSLIAIFTQVSPSKSRHYILTLLDAPVSLQKFGIRWAFDKLAPEELKPIFAKLWNSTKSSSIRAVLFTHTFDLLCKEKKEAHIKETWDLLCIFIDTLTADDNKLLFKKLGMVADVPDTIKPQFYMKSYTFLTSLPAKCNCDNILNEMQCKAADFMELLDNDFVVNVMLKTFIETFAIKRINIYDNARVVSSFILSSKDEKSQMERYEISLAAILDKYLPQWSNIHEQRYIVKENVKEVLESLTDSLIYTFEKQRQIPFKTFEAIQNKLENSLSYEKDYVLLTLWKLVVSFVKILNENNLVPVNYNKDVGETPMTDEEKDKMFSETHKTIAPLFSKMCVLHLKKDIEQYGPSIYSLFSKSFTNFFQNSLSRYMCKLEDQTEYALCLLRYDNGKEVWLMVHDLIETNLYKIYSDNEKKKYEELRGIVLSHPSKEIKMHYNALFSDVVPFVSKNSTEIK